MSTLQAVKLLPTLLEGTRGTSSRLGKHQKNLKAKIKKLLPTLTATEARRGATGMGKSRQGGPTLKVALGLYPTLTASEGKRGSGQTYARGNPTLTGAMRDLAPTLTATGNLLSPSMQKWPGHRRLLPTLTANRYGSTNNGSPHDGREEYATKGTPSLDSLIGQEGGQLSLPFCEWYMGFPEGWVSLSDEALAEYHKERSAELLETRSSRRAAKSQATSSEKSSRRSRRKVIAEPPAAPSAQRSLDEIFGSEPKS